MDGLVGEGLLVMVGVRGGVPEGLTLELGVLDAVALVEGVTVRLLDGVPPADSVAVDVGLLLGV